MTKNPYVVFEKTMKLTGRIIIWLFLGVSLGALFIALPIVGTMNGWAWDRTWMGYILVVSCVGVFLLVWPVMAAAGWVSAKWRKAKRAWERKNES